MRVLTTYLPTRYSKDILPQSMIIITNLILNKACDGYQCTYDIRLVQLMLISLLEPSVVCNNQLGSNQLVQQNKRTTGAMKGMNVFAENNT